MQIAINSNYEPGGHELHLVPGVLDIGRANENHIQLDDPAVSHHHARIVTYFHESLVIDLDSRNGIYLNGERVFKHTLKAGDELRIGRHSFVIRPANDWFLCEAAIQRRANDPARPMTNQASR